MTQSKQQIKEDKAIVAIIEALGFDPEEVVQVIDSNVSGKTPVKEKKFGLILRITCKILIRF